MNKKSKIVAITCVVIGIVAIAIGLLFPKKDKVYVVSFDTDGGSQVATQEVKENEMVKIPDPPTKENYTFLRWELNEKEYDFTTKVTENITLKAVWNENIELEHYKITFVVNGDIKEMEVTGPNEIDINSLGFPEKTGYEIKWYVDGKEYDLSTPITSDMKIEGKYVKTTTSSTLNVKFDSKGGTSVKSQSVKNGETATEPTDVTYEGYIFDGWYLNNKVYDFSTPVTKNITLVAKWKEDPEVKRYTVKFDSDGGSKVTEQRVIENKQATMPKTPTKAGYKFVEWELDNKKYDFKSKVTKDITLKAKWEESVQYTVTFDSQGGSKIDSIKVAKGAKVSKPKDPTKSGYKFVLWLLDNSEFDFNTPINENITLVARYSAVSVTPTPTPKPTATPTPANNNYEVRVTKADELTIDNVLKVYNNNSQQISFQKIEYDDGVLLCTGSKPYASNSDLVGISTLIVVLNDGSKVRATLKK